MKKNKTDKKIQTPDQPLFDFKNEDRNRWNRRKAGKKSFVRW